MKFKYLGKNEGMQVFGHDFSDGATPDVTDEKAIAKLMGNAEFEAVDDAPAPPAPPKEEKPKGDKKEEKQKEEKALPAGDGLDGNLPGMGA